MPIVPFSRGQAAATQMPSETNLLMALADMHKNGRFADRMEEAGVPPSSNIDDRRARNPIQGEIRNNTNANVDEQARAANVRSDAFQAFTPSGIVAGQVKDMLRRRSEQK